jgi:hypothetical protein
MRYNFQEVRFLDWRESKQRYGPRNVFQNPHTIDPKRAAGFGIYAGIDDRKF